MLLSWQVKGTDTNNQRYFFTGLQELKQVNHVVCKVPASHLYKVIAKIAFPTKKSENSKQEERGEVQSKKPSVH